MLDAKRIREDFPILRRQVHGKPLVYLDNAASTRIDPRVEEAMRKHRALRIAYIDRYGRRSERIIEPVRLVEGSGDAVYLVALSGEAKEERNFRVDRIVGLDPA